MASQLLVCRLQAVCSALPRVLLQVTGVVEVPGSGQCVSRHKENTSEEERGHKQQRKYKHVFSTQRRHRRTSFLQDKASQLLVCRLQAVCSALPRALLQVTGVVEVPGSGQCVSRHKENTSEEERRHRQQRKYKHVFSTQRRHRRTSFLQDKMCRATVWPAVTPARGMATASLTWESVLSEENKASVKARLAKQQSPRRLQQQDTVKRVAAVLLPVCHVEGELSLLYTMRCLSLSAHAGQVSFPGGMADPEDRDVVHTALREAQEEVGLRGEEGVEVLGVLPPVPNLGQDTEVVGVLAYVGHLDPDTLTLSPGEVEAVIVASLRNLCHPAHAKHTQFRSDKFPRGYTLPVYLGTEPRVWGLTAIFTHMALSALLPGLYTHRPRHIAPLLPS